MIIYLYNTSSAPNALTKTLSDESMHEGAVRGEINVVAPVIDIVGNIHGFNYARIPDFNNRKYFIEEMRIVRNGITRITLKCDPLTSFAGQIRNLPCVVIRSQQKTAQTPYLYDSKRPLACYQVYKTFKLFEFTGMGNNVILVTAG